MVWGGGVGELGWLSTLKHPTWLCGIKQDWLQRWSLWVCLQGSGSCQATAQRERCPDVGLYPGCVMCAQRYARALQSVLGMSCAQGVAREALSFFIVTKSQCLAVLSSHSYGDCSRTCPPSPGSPSSSSPRQHHSY